MGSLDGQWGKLTIRERIHLCREYAQEAEQLAHAAHPDRKADYKRIAADWHQIAAELEQFGTAKSAFPTEDAHNDSRRARGPL
jgi:hypothetical protein